MVKATISSDYRWRLGLVGALVLFFSLWFFYDAGVNYPAMQEAAAKYRELIRDATPPREEAWKEYAAEAGIGTEQPEDKSEGDIRLQWTLGFVCLPVGLLFLITWIRTKFWWVASDGQTITTSWGQSVPFEAIRSVDTTRWKTKGIAVVHFVKDGQDGRLVLDDWKFNRNPIVEIYRQVSQHLNPSAADAEAAPAAEPPTADDNPNDASHPIPDAG